MISTCVMVYLGAWLVTAVGTYIAGRMLADHDRPAENMLLLSLGAGAVWPLLLLGAIELSSVWVYTAATSRSEPEIPESWLGAGAMTAVGPLR